MMKRRLLTTTLAVLTIGLLGSCKKDIGPETPRKNLPEDALSGEFSVSDTKKVYFSKGNLWADDSKALHFEDAQWNSTPSSNGKYNASHVSHFTWSDDVTSAVDSSFSYSKNNLFCDESNKVSVDGSDPIYYALSTAEWQYLFNTASRMKNNKPCYSNAMSGVTIESKTYKGVFLYPDDYNGLSGAMTWEKINAAGIVFLPAAGFRSSSNVYYVDDFGYYWSSTATGNYYAYRVCFNSDDISPDDYGSRSLGFSVRLVADVR